MDSQTPRNKADQLLRDGDVEYQIQTIANLFEQLSERDAIITKLTDELKTANTCCNNYGGRIQYDNKVIADLTKRIFQLEDVLKEFTLLVEYPRIAGNSQITKNTIFQKAKLVLNT